VVLFGMKTLLTAKRIISYENLSKEGNLPKGIILYAKRGETYFGQNIFTKDFEKGENFQNQKRIFLKGSILKTKFSLAKTKDLRSFDIGGENFQNFEEKELICKIKSKWWIMWSNMVKLLQTHIQLSSKLQFESYEHMMNNKQVIKLDFSDLFVCVGINHQKERDLKANGI
jgi:hypothetical protein